MSDVFANKRSILHKGDGNQHVSGPPDVCKTPSPGGPVPIPYPNIAMDSNLAKGAKKVKINGNPVAHEGSNLSTSTGDEAGTAGGGILSSKTKGKLTWGSSSGDVKVEGKGVARFMDVTEHNGNVWNTVLTAMGSVTVPGYGDDPIDRMDCSICGAPKSEHRIAPQPAELQLAQQLANNLRNKDRAFANAFKSPSGKPLKKGVMIGVLTCQCHEGKRYAGLAGMEYTDGAYLASAEAFQAEASALGLTPVVDAPKGPPRSGNVPPKPPATGFGAISEEDWEKTQERSAHTNAKWRGNAPLTCAAPKMTQKCLEEGHKPGKMVEVWVGMRADSTVEISRFLRIHYDSRSPDTVKQPTWFERQAFGDGDAVPSCSTCQVMQTVMLCKLRQAPCP